MSRRLVYRFESQNDAQRCIASTVFVSDKNKKPQMMTHSLKRISFAQDYSKVTFKKNKTKIKQED